uniref:RNA polymerase II-associated protein 3 n=1 Tax=Saccoglossus kowalevskii TaxID=10224 RepID=A0ABM0MLB7_SACKO|nr:PREDICTED: RNA polymerase II-associated protein 3-like [Saccoglossus kowalevskii]
MMEKALEIQNQVRQNAAELNEFLSSMNQWEANVKKKDQKLKQQKEGSDVKEEESLPPVRNSVVRPKKKKKKEKTLEKERAKEEEKKRRIRSYDFKAWDKFDVDKACAELDSDNEDKKSSSEYETDSEAELEAERSRQQAIVEKDRGNAYFKEGLYKEAVHCYTTAISCDSYNAIFPANRAMAYLKMEKYEEAEYDCNTALSLDYTYVKAYHRRGTARIHLGQLDDAKKDFEQILNLEPSNKQAVNELKRIEQLMRKREEDEIKKAKEAEKAIVKPIKKLPHERSKKPLRRLHIEEIGGTDDEEEQINTNKQTEVKPVVKEIQKSTFTSPADFGNMCNTETKQMNGILADEHKDNIQAEQNRETSTQNDSDNTKMKSIKASSSPTTVQTTSNKSPSIPDVPSTSFQLLADWKSLQQHPQLLYQYFKKIPASSFPKLFQQNKDPVFDILKHLSEVKRFGMNVMFMSSPDKKVLKDLFEYMKSSQPEKAADIEVLAKIYEL